MEIRTISEELKRKYGTKVYRLSLTSGCTCPNRDGRAGYGGCTFCSEGGSGDFASPFLSVPDQIQYAKTAVSGKIKAKYCPHCGAPLDLNQSGVCSYCHSVVTSDDHDWVLAKIEGVMQRTM